MKGPNVIIRNWKRRFLEGMRIGTNHMEEEEEEENITCGINWMWSKSVVKSFIRFGVRGVCK